MHARFWGTRGSIAKPGPQTVRYGGNTSCVEVRAADGSLLVLDCGTGAHGLGAALARTGGGRRGHLLIGHTHWDHIQGFPFFAPLRDTDNEWDVYGPRGVGHPLRDVLARQMSYAYFPVPLTDLAAEIRYHELVEGAFDIGPFHVEARYLNHPAVTLGYRIEADGAVLVYSTDHEPHSRSLALGESDDEPARQDDAHAEFLAGADLVIHDAQYTATEYPERVGWGHSTVEYVVDRTRDNDIARLALFHHDPMRDDAAVDRLVRAAEERLADAAEPMRVLGAAEGTVIDIAPRAARSRGRRPAPSAKREPAPAALAHRVLVVATDPAVLDPLRAATAADGLALVECGDHDTLLDAVREGPTAIVLIEAAHLVGKLAAVLREVRTAASGAGCEPVIVAVGRDDEASTAPVRGATIDEWVAAPFSAAYLRSRLRAWRLRQACRWTRAGLPRDEAGRLATLRSLGLLDTEPEERFDRYTRIAAALFRVPAALVTLVDRDRQWFKSAHGLDVRETPRDQAFCAHAILDDVVFQVADARAHPDFADNPLVCGPPFIRFYAGAPLAAAPGARVGTLCLLDYDARELDATELALLHDLARLVEHELSAGSAAFPPGAPR